MRGIILLLLFLTIFLGGKFIMKKRILALALTIIMVCSMAACGSKMSSLSDWMSSSEKQTTLDLTNKALESTGMSVDFSADGNTFVYEYYLPDDAVYNSITPEQAAATLGPVVDSNKASVEELFSSFESQYKLTLDGARMVFFKADGTELYSADIPNN